MNTRRKIFSAVLALTFIACMVLPCMQEKVWAAEETFQFADDENYKYMKEGLNQLDNTRNGGCTFNDTTKEITVDFEKITTFELIFGNYQSLNVESQQFINNLFEKAVNLETVDFVRVKFESIDFSKLENGKLKHLRIIDSGITSIPDISLPNLVWLELSGNNFSADGACAGLKDPNFPQLIHLTLHNCKLTSIPDISLSNLKYLCLSENDFSADGACANLDSTHFPVLNSLYLDECGISNMEVISGLGSDLVVLSLGKNRLTDDALDALVKMRDKFPNLQKFYIGQKVYYNTSLYATKTNSNKITDTKKLVSLLTAFSNLKKMDLSNLKIASLQDFSGIGNDVEIDFTDNKIIDFAGLESNPKITLWEQSITISGNYAPGLEGELPELLKRILDPDDPLYGSVNYYQCELSDNGTKLSIRPDAGSSSINVKSGKLSRSTITIQLKEIPQYEIPQDLTATVGDTLATVTLPTGFAWKNAAQDVGAEGTNTFAAVYTPQDTDKYVIVDVDIPVTVMKPAEINTLKITTQPQDITLTEGGEGTLTVIASGSGALSYQWYKDDALVNGASSSSLTLSNAVLADGGSYKVKVTDENGSITSESAVVTVNKKAPAESETTTWAEPETTTWAEPETEPTKPVVSAEPETEPTKPVVPVEPTAAPSDEYDEDNEDETEETQVVAAVKTSDTSPVVPVMVLLLVSGMVLCITVLDKKNDYIKK